ncbi:LysM peptidoglycan-binding domain-containing protein [Neptuniibacter sp. 2_MG-2023]|uniref:lytic transglycosylase n=1 Tax=Neptuniibacter sp. 2_MG-2023 TaxID=3062671 RepID=UPI0026E40E64|nr:LysM peptidoglycan-binding domain-containing protein [Neptuniibacter sp. 2_MG-2023]MDO6514668.1 LysM peptidoglycan-binding domain-containing protein [Neptuniibacter sp. 2_MG-2023]
MHISNKAVFSFILSSIVLTGCQTVTEKPVSLSSNDIKFTEASDSSYSNTVTAKETKPSQVDATQPSDLWQITRENMALDLSIDKQRVQSQIKWYSKHPKYIDRVVKRAEPYYYHILTQALERGLPTELALLPIVESAFDPFAYSHGRAAGAWQFIPSTGKHFGLEQNWWYDGRRDIISSTDAAYTYLAQLNKRFDGDWLLALAAYNAGGGNVSRAIKRNKRQGKPTDFWSLNLPKETMAYVPKLLAIAELIKHPEQYDLAIQPISNQPYFTAIDTQSQIDLAQAASMAGITTKELYLLNPGFNRWATAPEGPHRLLIPIENAVQFNEALAQLPASERVKWTRYKIKSGDSLIAIAKKFETTTSLIRKTNNIQGNNIRAGKTILVPTATQQASEYALSQHQRHIQKQKTISRSTDRKDTYYTVKSGDSFWSIAQKNQVGVRQLASWNSMAPNDALPIGKRLVIWSKPTQSVLSSADRQIIRKVGYKVRSGDSLARIAEKFNVRIADILHWNNLDKAKYLKPGQSLTLYVDVTRSK